MTVGPPTPAPMTVGPGALTCCDDLRGRSPKADQRSNQRSRDDRKVHEAARKFHVAAGGSLCHVDRGVSHGLPYVNELV
jgi:hypothetical protein